MQEAMCTGGHGSNHSGQSQVSFLGRSKGPKESKSLVKRWVCRSCRGRRLSFTLKLEL